MTSLFVDNKASSDASTDAPPGVENTKVKKICKKLLKGIECSDQDCIYMHSIQELTSNNEFLNRNKACKHYMRKYGCFNGRFCPFAHPGECLIRPSETMPSEIRLVTRNSLESLTYKNANVLDKKLGDKITRIDEFYPVVAEDEIQKMINNMVEFVLN